MKKRTGIITLIVMIVLTVLAVYTAAVGWGPTGTGAAKNIKTGLDLSGGVSITYEAEEAAPSPTDMDDTVFKLQQRVSNYSTEANVYKEGVNRINVEIPGVTDANAILQELGEPTEPDPAPICSRGSTPADAAGRTAAYSAVICCSDDTILDPMSADLVRAGKVIVAEEPADTMFERAIAQAPDDDSIHYAFLLNPDKDEDHPLEPYACTEPRQIVTFDPTGGILPKGEGKRCAFSGRLIGGCMDILATLCGTQYDRVNDFSEKYREDGLVWFLEACDLSVFGIRRAIWQLKNAGWFEHVNGFLIGRPWAGQKDMMNLDHIHAVTDLLDEYNVPVLLDVDIGHLPPMMPIISGSMADVSYDPNTDDFYLRMRLE